MALTHTHNPWIYRRDEVDLLEQEMDALYRIHEARKGEKNYLFEERVLDEQMETEDQSENAIVLEFGSQWFVYGDEHTHVTDRSCPEVEQWWQGSLRERLRRDSLRHPLYITAYRWAQSVMRTLRPICVADGKLYLNAFRAYANAPLVPMKIAFAQLEEGREDPLALFFAKKEYSLALTYLGRVRESLAQLGDASPNVNDLFAQSQQILSALERTNKRFGSDRKWRT